LNSLSKFNPLAYGNASAPLALARGNIAGIGFWANLRPANKKESAMCAVAVGYDLCPEVVQFLASPRKLLINGRWVESHSGQTFEVLDPATGDEVAQVARGDAHDINQAVAAARKAFESGPWHKMTPSERGRLLWKLGDLIEQHADALAQLETLDNGKPLGIARAADVALAADQFRYYAGWATKLLGETIPISVVYAPDTEWQAYTKREPVGVVGQIIPWNFPLLMAAWKLAPALTCGCTVVLKPAEQTPLSALYLGQLIQEAGFPDGVVNIVTGYAEEAARARASTSSTTSSTTWSTAWPTWAAASRWARASTRIPRWGRWYRRNSSTASPASWKTALPAGPRPSAAVGAREIGATSSSRLSS
jgi:hypothetical protein